MAVHIKNNFGTIIGGTIIGNCHNVVINGGKVKIDGKTVDLNEIKEKEIHIHIEGTVESLDVDACEAIKVNGSVGFVKTMSGNVTVSNNVLGSVKTMSGDIDCGKVSGNISTMSGDIRQIFTR